MKRSPSIFLLVFSFFINYSFAQEQDSIPRKVYETRIIAGTPPVIDGIFDEAVWSAVEWGGDFIQRSPYEGQAPTQETQFKILYDAKYLYFAFRCYDTQPDSIVKRMSRRDGFEGDWVEVNIDSYNDKRSAFSFTTSVSGVKGDEFVSNNGGNWDASWNPIWNTKTNIDSLGWSAEVRIPLSQIRYGNKEEHVWGLQFTRRDFRQESRSVWQFVPQNSGNWVSSFGELRGLKGIKPQKQVEIQPYIVAQAESFEKEEGNPFATGSDFKLNGGVDGKIGLTSDLTLDFTINPDFGQVEADPSVLTLDGFQVFFSERRPFFIENRNLFDYRYAGAEAGGPFTSDNLFYSRRIGGRPHASPDLLDEEYADVPDNTTILGAAKFSGKTKKGLGIGILESVTARETAPIDYHGERREEVVEPLTNYFVGRATQDFKEGETVLGGIFTATTRDLNDTGLGFLHKNAFTGGADFQHWWKDRTWFIAANGVFSRVEGSSEAILNTQTSFEHHFQRPNASHVEVDSTATSLTGTGGMVKIGRLNKKWMLETGVTWRSPELELNDIGFMTNTDEINYFLWTGYRWTEPFSIFRRIQLNYNHWARWDFGGNNLYQAVNTNTHLMFKNFWGMGGGFTYENKDISNNALFGGPALRKSQGVAPWIYLYSDQRKVIRLEVNAFFAWGFEKNHPQTVRISDYSVWIGIQPTNALNLSIGPSYNQHERQIQYVTDLDFQDHTRYITGTVDQRTFSTTLRLNYSITPDLTLQYYGQPFISRGRYRDFKYITHSMAKDFSDRFHLFTDAEIGFNARDEEYAVDENYDGVTDYTFSDPDFNFIQFRSNLVARWEYIPGSEIFLVWSQGTTHLGDPVEKLIPGLTENLFSEKAQNIFLLKLTYRFLK
ncbi:MAG: carbohydrate binding family 9 domain-containing protein [Lewinellaceae bacterium]|nr:carbohydrate binding family 9 domain-containing protein [Lewinellaceae bacterium]